MYIVRGLRTLALATVLCSLAGTAARATAVITGIEHLAPYQYDLGALVYLRLVFSEPVTVTGSPSIGVRIGSTDRQFTNGYAWTQGSEVIFSYHAQSGDNGSMTVTGPVALNGGTIKAADGSDASLAFSPIDAPEYVFDTTPPAAPVVSAVTPASPTYQQAFTISGTAEANTAVWIRTPSGQLLGTGGQVDSGGNWTINVPAQPAGTYNYEVFNQDRAGNISPATPLTVTVQAGPPVPGIPTITGVQAPAAGTYNIADHTWISIFVTFSQAVIVTGKPTLLATVGTTTTEFDFAGQNSSDQVTFVLNAAVQGSGLSITGPIKLNGGSIKGTDGDDASLSFAPVDAPGVLIDKIPPNPPVITSVTPASPTTDQPFTVSGTSEPLGSVIYQMDGGQVETTAVDASGHWAVAFPAMAAGDHVFAADAEDSAGNFAGGPAGMTAHQTITVQPAGATTTLAITSVTPGRYPLFTGTGSPGDTIEVTSSDRLIRHLPNTTVASDGTWSISTNPIGFANGTYTFVANTVSPTGAYVSASAPVTFTINEPAPTGPHVTIDEITPAAIGTSGPWSIRGSAPAGATVNVTLVDSVGSTLPGTLPATTADAAGHWTLSAGIDAELGGYVFTAGASDAAGTTIEPSGIVYFAVTAPAAPPSQANQTITFSSPVGAVMIGQPIQLGATSSAGLPITYTVVSGDATISGNVLTPHSTATLIVRAASAGNASYAAASTDVNFGQPQKAAQAISVQSSGGDVTANTPVMLNATASSGLPVSYAVVSGPATISGNTLTFTGTGPVTVRASQSGSATVAAADGVTLTYVAHPIPRFVNISSRVHLTAGQTAIAGFVVTGSTAKKMLVRAVGAGLAEFGVSDPLADPHLTVYDSSRTAIASNAGWADDPQIAAADSAVGAFSLTPGSTDAALVVTLPPGAYTAQVTSRTGGSVLMEVYDLGANDAVPTKQLINVSTRAPVDAAHALFEGFVIAGDQPKRVLIRGIGPTLATFGVGDALSDTRLEIYSGQTLVARNDDWSTPEPVSAGPAIGSAADITVASSSSGAFALPAGSKDAAVVLTLPPGAYTAIVRGSSTESGEALAEVYEVP